MAAGDILITVGTQISFADHAGDFGPAANAVIEVGTPTNVQITLASLASGAARQSAKVDLGATRAPSFSVLSCFEAASGAASNGDIIGLFWAPSHSATAAVGNPGGVSGADAAYTGTGQASVTDSLPQLQRIGAHVATADDTGDTPPYQIALVNARFVPAARYGSLVVLQSLGGNLHSDDVEMNIVFTPNIPQGQ